MWDSILGPWDHALSQRQMLNHLATRASQEGQLLIDLLIDDLLID